MSNHYNEALLENLFEEALELGLSDEKAEPIALPILSLDRIVWTCPIGPASPMSNN